MKKILSVLAASLLMLSYIKVEAQQKEDPRNKYEYCISGTYQCYPTPAQCENENRFHVGKKCEPKAITR